MFAVGEFRRERPPAAAAGGGRKWPSGWGVFLCGAGGCSWPAPIGERFGGRGGGGPGLRAPRELLTAPRPGGPEAGRVVPTPPTIFWVWPEWAGMSQRLCLLDEVDLRSDAPS